MSSKVTIPSSADVVIVGGGLSGGLTALRLAVAKPELKVVLLLEKSSVSAPQTWCFRGSDVSEESLIWLKPLISKSWDNYEVSFPSAKRAFSSPLHAIRSEDFERELKSRLPGAVFFDVKINQVSGSLVRFEKGSIEARCVLDAREPATSDAAERLHGFRKSIAYGLKLNKPHGFSTPLLIDADCPQMDGLRYFRVLPWTDTDIMIEEVFLSNSPSLNDERLSRSVISYAERKNWQVDSVTREERTAWPLPLTAQSLAPFGTSEDAIKIGRAGGYYHSATSEELPDTVRFAEFFSSLPDLTTAPTREALLKFRRSWLSKQRFHRMLNRFMFFAAESPLRFHLLRSLYEFPEEVVERFFGGRLTWGDRIRILSHRPQSITFARAARTFRERHILDRVGVTSEAPTTTRATASN